MLVCISFKLLVAYGAPLARNKYKRRLIPEDASKRLCCLIGDVSILLKLISCQDKAQMCLTQGNTTVKQQLHIFNIF